MFTTCIRKAALLAALAGLLGVPARAVERYTLAGASVAIYNLAGEIEVLPGEGADVVVEVTRGGADAERLRVETGPVEGRPSLRVIYPGRRVHYRNSRHQGRTTLHVAPNGVFGGRNWGWRQVTISTRGGSLEAHADLAVRVPRGKTVSVHLAVGELRATDVEGDLRLDTHSAPVIARGIRGPLWIDVGSGHVEVSDVQGELSVDTGSGHCELARVSGARITVDTGSGGVSGEGLTARSLHVDTGSGHVGLTDVDAREVLVDTGSGGVELGLLSDVERVVVDTGSGGVTLRVPESLGATLDVDTGSGTIEVDLPHRMQSYGRDHYRGTLGDGVGRITVSTGSGGVQVVKG